MTTTIEFLQALNDKLDDGKIVVKDGFVYLVDGLGNETKLWAIPTVTGACSDCTCGKKEGCK